MKYKVLHISPHLGGGVGNVLLSYFKLNKNSEEFEDYIYCLDFINNEAKTFLNKINLNFEESMIKKIEYLLAFIEEVDIVIIHWWNHPLLYEFLVKYKLPISRVAVWSHVSGNSEPQSFTPQILEYPDIFVFTTPLSEKNKYVQEIKKKKDIFSTIWAGSDLIKFNKIKKKKHRNFLIGYIGTVDFSKMYRRILFICERFSFLNAKFIICGSGSSIEILKSEVKKYDLEEKVEILGFQNDIKSYLEQLDVFFYPLSKNHYGTCDLVLAEAMAAGVVPVVFDNEMEKFMIKNLYTGLVVSSEDDFIYALEKLYKNKELLFELSINCRTEALERFSIDKTVYEWKKTLKDLLFFKKSEKKWKGLYSGENIESYQIFLESIDKKREIFEKDDIGEIQKLKEFDSWNSKTKGSLYHYLLFFEQDKTIKKWISYLEKELR